MSVDEKNATAVSAYSTSIDHENLSAVKHADDVLLAQLGYKSEFKREFSVSRPSAHVAVATLVVCSLWYLQADYMRLIRR